MPLSPPIAKLIAAFAPSQPTEALAGLGASDELAAVVAASRASSVQWVSLGRWEVAPSTEAIARADLGRANGGEVLAAHSHFLGLANDAGGLTAAVGWNPGEPEVVYTIDPEYATVKRSGTLAAWLVNAALSEAQPSALAQSMRCAGERVDAAPPALVDWQPEAAVAASLKGGGHVAFAEVGGCAVALHKKGVRAWIDGKKKAKAIGSSALRLHDAAGEALWVLESKYTDSTVHRLALPSLELSERKRPATGDGIVALSATHAAIANKTDVEVIGWVDGQLQVVARYATACSEQPSLVGSRTGWLTVGFWKDGRTQLWRWDGAALRVVAGWPDSGSGVVEVDGVLYGQRYNGGWYPVRMVL